MGENPGVRKTGYLRISVSDRGNFRCRYCTYWRSQNGHKKKKGATEKSVTPRNSW
jgi:molybdenum cofactor biosynthesis enzyme MoaA